MCLISAPGGTLSDDMTCTEFCLFKAQEDMETMQAYAQVNTTVFSSRFNIHLFLWIIKQFFPFRSLTSSLGATNTWRRDLKRRSKRFVSLHSRVT